MWDGWEKQHGAISSERASLAGFRRDFNKASVLNWGSETHPCPTLGLSPDASSKCEGMAFRFPISTRQQVKDAFQKREGGSFQVQKLLVELLSGQHVEALVAVNDTSKNTFIGDLPLAERARMTKRAGGSSGTCEVYARGIYDTLRAMGITDNAVNAFWREMSCE